MGVSIAPPPAYQRRFVYGRDPFRSGPICPAVKGTVAAGLIQTGQPLASHEAPGMGHRAATKQDDQARRFAPGTSGASNDAPSCERSGRGSAGAQSTAEQAVVAEADVAAVG